jgi:hypothetical protein
MENFEVKEIDYKSAMKIVLNNHYLHRKCPCSIAVGLIKNNYILGVIVFGKPSSYTLCEGIAGKEESKNVIEFNRLWVCDTLPKNTESWFISRAIKICPYEIIVSFADTEQGHVGYIYQATNWIYCGESKKQKYFRLKNNSNNKGGTEYIRRERMPKSKIINEYGQEYVEEYYSSLKHRYIYFNTTKHRKKELFKKLRYKILPYPKNILLKKINSENITIPQITILPFKINKQIQLSLF